LTIVKRVEAVRIRHYRGGHMQDVEVEVPRREVHRDAAHKILKFLEAWSLDLRTLEALAPLLAQSA